MSDVNTGKGEEREKQTVGSRFPTCRLGRNVVYSGCCNVGGTSIDVNKADLTGLAGGERACAKSMGFSLRVRC